MPNGLRFSFRPIFQKIAAAKLVFAMLFLKPEMF